MCGKISGTWEASKHLMVVRGAPLSGQKCIFIVSLVVTLCPLSFGAMRVDGGWVVCHRWGFLFCLSSPSKNTIGSSLLLIFQLQSLIFFIFYFLFFLLTLLQKFYWF